MSEIPPRKRHDRTYRLLFSQPRMIEDLVRGFICEPWIEELDFTTLEPLNASHVSERLHSRDGDGAWRLRVRGTSAWVYLLVEFQSEVQRFMALRQAAYQVLFYQQLLKQGELTEDGRLPIVLTIVVYNGRARWLAPVELAELIRVLPAGSAPYAPRLRLALVEMEVERASELASGNLVALLIRLETSRSRSSLRRVVRDLVAALPGPDEGGLRRAFVVWLQRVLLPAKGEEDIPELVGLEGFRAMLIERVEEWSREIEARAEKKWRKEERRELLLRQLEIKFGEIDQQTRSRVLAAGPQRLLRWAERLVTAEILADVFRR